MVNTSSPHRYAYIDALRGYAVLGVISVHTSQNVPNLQSPLSDLAASGRFGVQLFFVASALTLMLSWHARSDGALPFYIRRLFRIAPMFWLAIPLYYAIYGLGPRYWAPDGVTWQDIAATATFLHGWHPRSINSVVPGGWSIAVEMTFYAVFPFLAYWLQSWTRVIGALVVSIIFARIAGVSVQHALPALTPDQPEYLIQAFAGLWFFNQLPVFLIGFVTFFALRDIRLPQALVRAGLLLSMTAILLLPFLRIPAPANVQYSLCFGVFAFSLGRGAGRYLVNRPIRKLGKISFSAYLWQFAVLFALNDTPQWMGGWKEALGLDASANSSVVFFVMLSIVVSITAVLSAITYRFIEQPMIAVGGRIARLCRVNDEAALSFLW